MTDLWNLKKFGDCADLIRDTIAPEAAQNVPYIGLEHIIEGGLTLSGYGFSDDVISAKNRFKKGDILFGKLRPYFRKVIIAPFDGVCSTDIWVVRTKPGIEQRFLFYWMASLEFVEEATRASEGTKMPRAKWEFVSRIEKEIPPLPAQRTIAHILGSLDDKIKVNRQMNETLEVMAQAIFQSWFVDFDPVRAKAEGGWPVGMDAATAALFPSEFEEIEGMEVPKEWRVIQLSAVCENIYSGGTPSTENAIYWDGDIPWLSSGETRNHFIVATENYISPDGVSNSSTRLVRSGATVIASAGQGHTRGQTSLLLIDSYINQSIVALTADASIISDLYLFFDLSRRYEELRQISDSHSSRGSLTTKLLAQLDMVVPSQDIMSKFNQLSKPLVDQIHENLIGSRALIEIRDLLLPKLMSGEIVIENK